MKLIVNADDLGYSSGVNRGITKACDNGIVTSTTILMNRESTGQGIKLASEKRLPAVGVHLCLSSGQPLTNANRIPGIVDKRGNFLSRGVITSTALPSEQVKIELTEQIQRAIAGGVNITHLDSHHHVHKNPAILEVVADLALEYELPVRSVDQPMREYLKGRGIKTCDWFIGGFFGQGATHENLILLLEEVATKCRGEVVELMTHPGEIDQLLLQWSTYREEREKELKVLTADGLATKIHSMGFTLANYRTAWG